MENPEENSNNKDNHNPLYLYPHRRHRTQTYHHTTTTSYSSYRSSSYSSYRRSRTDNRYLYSSRSRSHRSSS